MIILTYSACNNKFLHKTDFCDFLGHDRKYVEQCRIAARWVAS